MRLYIPATLDDLRDGVLTLPVPRRAHAVTPALTGLLPEEDEEGVEFAAQLMAADDALVLLAGTPSAPTLRLVVTAEVADDLVDVTPAGGDEPVSLVALTGEVTADGVVCVHVDEPEAAARVAQALDGDDAALEDLAERDLLWYDVSELGRIPR
ncbi:hypothetical protein [Cellulomonas sp. NPDC089187]|uniref:DUF6912 family protein n=1 Tax=Cellulomonas sp. NPDC089187 TaxID=3154970 RepID=UPI0034251056